MPVAIRREDVVSPKSFEFDLPEHLPNSPMCPANKKHRSGGTGVCVYHGRRKQSSLVHGSDGSGDEGNQKGLVDRSRLGRLKERRGLFYNGNADRV